MTIAQLARVTAESPAFDAIRSYFSEKSPAAAVANPAEKVSLNPQPLPPRYAETLTQRGISGGADRFDFDDNWCGTPWPHHFPLPGPSPVGPQIDSLRGLDVLVGARR